MRDLIIFGAGGFGRETVLMVSQINAARATWNVIGFCDDNIEAGQTVDGLQVLGGLQFLNEYKFPVSVAIAVAAPYIRKRVRNNIKNSNVDFPVLIHPSALPGDTGRNYISEGTIITAGNILTTNIRIGPFVIVNLASTIGHDVVIGGYCSIMPGASISGSVQLGNCVEVGTGARILPGITVGSESRVGAGAVVTRDIPDAVTVVGIPARQH